MNAIIKIQNIYDEILEETEPKLVLEKGKKVYVGALFFECEKWQKRRKVLEQIEVNGSMTEILLTACDMLKRHNMTKADDKTFQTMAHWQYMNGVSDDMMIENYGFKSDTDYIEFLTAQRA